MALMASFTSASAALDAAIAMQRAITEYFAATETPLRIRVGINAGEPLEEDDDLYGTAVIRAARVMGEAPGGEVLVADIVRQLVAGRRTRSRIGGTGVESRRPPAGADLLDRTDRHLGHSLLVELRGCPSLVPGIR